ncbi:MAG: carboxypeptidase regulatory-like domain-containing protein, partial [Clostridia bacterium]|nr:carboxypeptidase regulatory-like domain-containing protein [Clostridia bacterium]
YTLTAKHSRFAETLTRSISVSGSQSVSFTAAIMETVNIYVTDQNGANLADAAVVLGGKSVTTGKDGLASFQIKRGDYTARVSCSGYNTVSEALSVNQTITQRIKLAKS